MAAVAIQLSAILADFQVDDSQSKESLEQAIKLMQDVKSASLRQCDTRSKKISELLVYNETITLEKENIQRENKKLLQDIDKLTVSLQQYYIREEKLVRREEELRLREESIHAAMKSIENEKYQLEKSHEELSRAFMREREDFARTISEYDNKIRDFEITQDLQSRKIVELELKEVDLIRIQGELDDKIRSLSNHVEERNAEIITLTHEKRSVEELLADERHRVSEVEEKLHSVRKEISLEFNLQVSEHHQKESNYQTKIKELQSVIDSFQVQYQTINEKFKASETSIHEMIRFLHAVRRGRLQLFTDFEEYTTAWKTFFDSNIECLRRQYHVVISTNTEQWVRKDSKLSASVHHLLNELNQMTAAKYPYPQLRTDVPRDIDIEVLLTKLYVPVEQPVAQRMPMAPAPTVSENIGSSTYAYYTPQTQASVGRTRPRRGNRPASAGSSRGAGDRYKGSGNNNNNNSNISDGNHSHFVMNIRGLGTTLNEMS